MYLAPNFFADAPETVLERVALRYLEECVDEVRDCGGEISSPPRSPIDGSRSCEEVLCSHLRKVFITPSFHLDFILFFKILVFGRWIGRKNPLVMQ